MGPFEKRREQKPLANLTQGQQVGQLTPAWFDSGAASALHNEIPSFWKYHEIVTVSIYALC